MDGQTNAAIRGAVLPSRAEVSDAKRRALVRLRDEPDRAHAADTVSNEMYVERGHALGQTPDHLVITGNAFDPNDPVLLRKRLDIAAEIAFAELVSDGLAYALPSQNGGSAPRRAA